LYWDINAGNYTKCELVGLGHQHGHDTPLKEATKTEAEVKTKCGVHRQNTLKSSRTHSDLATIEPQEKQTALHQEGRRHAGPIATVPLPHHTSPARVKPSNPDLTTCGGLGSPAVGLHALLETPHGGGARNFRHSTPRRGSISEITIGEMCGIALLLRASSEPQGQHRKSTSPQSCTTHKASTSKPTHQGSRLRRLPTMNRNGEAQQS
jgi:hypothetical protein